MQELDGTHRSEEPVSKMTLNDWEGVPILELEKSVMFFNLEIWSFENSPYTPIIIALKKKKGD